ncbi:MAG: hypothetical protein BZ135_01525 [Methanosphaera sp. rholeuAM6]|nr:MAG: hypothetical protein BZ135_01525 [Methanosphaera sp. rholeuAM6]
MDLSFFNGKNNAIIMIILGIIALVFPLISTGTIGVLIGAIVLILAISLMINGIFQLSVSRLYGIFSILFGLLCLIFAYQLIFNPAVVSAIIGIIIYLFGILLIIIGIISILGPFRLIGITTIIFGIITLLVGSSVQDPKVLGTIIGIWLIISGIIALFDKDNGYIDVHI